MRKDGRFSSYKPPLFGCLLPCILQAPPYHRLWTHHRQCTFSVRIESPPHRIQATPQPSLIRIIDGHDEGKSWSVKQRVDMIAYALSISIVSPFSGPRVIDVVGISAFTDTVFQIVNECVLRMGHIGTHLQNRRYPNPALSLPSAAPFSK